MEFKTEDELLDAILNNKIRLINTKKYKGCYSIDKRKNVWLITFKHMMCEHNRTAQILYVSEKYCHVIMGYFKISDLLKEYNKGWWEIQTKKFEWQK
jgi:hypothetical protein